MMTTWIDDLRLGLRGVAAHKGIFALAGLILACGLGLAIAMACVVDAVLLRQLAYPNADRLVQVRELNAGGHAINLARPNHDDLAESVTAFADTTFYTTGPGIVATPERAIRAVTTTAGGDFFGVLGQAPAMGRAWPAGRHAPEVVIGHGLWQGLLQGRADVIGSGLRIHDVDYTVVGVMPPGFSFPGASAAWIPADPATFNDSRTAHNWRMLGLLRGQADLAPARHQAQALAVRLLAEHGDDISARGFDLTPLVQAVAAPVRTALQVLTVGVGFLLLIAVSNTLNLLLSQALGRGREFAVRAALGASRRRLLRQRLVENLALVGVAWVAGLIVAAAAIRVLVALAGTSLPRSSEIMMTPGIVLASAGLALAIALVLTAAAQLGARGTTPNNALREGGRGQSASRSTLRTQAGLLVAQTALTTVLLVAALLVGRSFLALMAVDPGFDAHGAVRVELNQPGSIDPAAAQANAGRYAALIEELSALPGVTAIGGVNSLPLTGGSNGAFWDHTVTDFERRPPPYIGYADFRVASVGYFEAAGIPLLRGRAFEHGDRAEGEHVAVISQRVAREVWGEADAIGRRIQVGNVDGDLTLVTVVGVVGDVHEAGLERGPSGTVYVNVAQRPMAAAQFNLVVRTELPLASLMPLLRERLERTVAQLPYSLHPLSEVRGQAMAQRRFNLVLLGCFAGAALVLAATGLYGLMAFSVGQRGSEFAIRQALGASAAGIGRLVLRGGLLITALGVAIGVALALSVSRLLASLLHGVPANDPATLAAVAAMLLAIAVVACLGPAWRAARVAPAATLH